MSGVELGIGVGSKESFEKGFKLYIKNGVLNSLGS